MIENRAFADAIMLSDHQWWVTGGENEDGYTRSTTEVFDATTKKFTRSGSLPYSMMFHNIFHINDTHIGLVRGAVNLSVYVLNR